VRRTSISLAGTGPSTARAWICSTWIPARKEQRQEVFLNKYKDGKLSEDWMIDFLANDPYHTKTDVMRQYFFKKPRRVR